MYYDSLEQEVVDLHYLTRENARRLVINSVKKSHSRKILCVKFITGRGNHINSTGERGVLYEKFPSWMRDSEIKYLVQDYEIYDGYYLVYLNSSNKGACANKSYISYNLLSSSLGDYLDYYKITYSNTNN
ncbi:DNA mismatch repair protein MutS [Rhizophagus irregularis DAOM 181602=DAOM 197198]|nr:DNA mismatch repair protein MutS [Rhizophagus irregularis DAOM 181602=DAOM 197198]